jgi:hypothetical protein
MSVAVASDSCRSFCCMEAPAGGFVWSDSAAFCASMSLYLQDLRATANILDNPR